MYNSKLNFHTICAVLLLIVDQCPIGDAARILGLVPLPSQSHAILGSTLLKEFALRGHNVTMISSFPLEEEVKNYRDIYIDVASRRKVHKASVIKASKFPFLKSYTVLESASSANDALLSEEKVKELVTSGEQFDLVINLGMDSMLGLSHALNAPTIRFSVIGMHSVYAAYTKNPISSAYVPNFLLAYSDEMSFFQRVMNAIMNLFIDFYIGFFWQRTENEIVQKHFPGAPHLSELQRNVQMTFVNSHMAIENVRPYLTNVIQIGGFHMQTIEELRGDLKSFLDHATDGVILFSMGSNINAKILRGKLKLMLKCFASLPYKILWKNDRNVEGQPDNVKTMKWFPQRSVLSHPNVKLFITHGGFGSILESVYNAVPLIILPIFLDQHMNAAQSMRNGYAIQLDTETLTEDKLYSAIMEVTTNPTYLNEIVIRSDALRHQEINPMERAVFWVERTLKHKNANYAKCKGSQMPLYKYYLFDVYAFIILAICTFTLMFQIVVKLLFRYCIRIVQMKLKIL